MSKKPDAEAFQDWICEDVLPQIRATGGFYNLRCSSNGLQLQLLNENDLHVKVVDFIRTFHREALLVVWLAELQEAQQKRIDSWRKGYSKGTPDLFIMNRSGKWSGFAMEFKTPASTGS